MCESELAFVMNKLVYTIYVPQTTKNKKVSVGARKRHGQHHHKGRHYIKVYLPYLPLFLIITGIVFSSGIHIPHKKSVLGYATEVSADSLLRFTNQQRVAFEKSPLTINSALSQAAQNKAHDMAVRNYWSHNTPDGQEPWIFFDNVGYKYEKAGENLAYGFKSSSDTVSGWMNSPGHRANILNGDYQEVGFGFANVENYNASGPETIVVAEYGRPLAATLPPPPETINRLTVASSGTPNKSAQPLPEHHVTRLQVISKGKLSWLAFVVGLFTGASLILVLARHSLTLRHVMRNGERFVAHHPLLDITLLSFVVLSAMLSKSIGIIG